MKKLIVAFCIISLGLSCNIEKVESTTDTELNNKRSEENPYGNQIGVVVNGQATITYDIETLKTRWSDVIKQGTIGTDNVLDLSFDAVTITIESGRYYLRGVDSGNAAKSSVRLIEIEGALYADDTNTTVTCSGCSPPPGPAGAGQCEPREVEGTGWYCTECDSTGCKKVVTTSTNDTF